MSVGSNPAFPIMNIPYESNAYVTNHLNIAISRKLLRIRIVYAKSTIKLVKILFSIGVIKNFTVVKSVRGYYIWLTPFFYKGVCFFKSLRLISTSSKKFYITYRALRLLSRSVGSSIYIVSTSKGLMTHYECLRCKIGGILLCAIA